MGEKVDVDSKALADLSSHITDIQHRIQLNVRETRNKAAEILENIEKETARRQRRADDLERRYNACRRTAGADCSGLQRQVFKAREELAEAKAAKSRAQQAVGTFRRKSAGVLERLHLFSVAGKRTLGNLKQHLDDYSAFVGLVTSSVLGAARPQPRAYDLNVFGVAGTFASQQSFERHYTKHVIWKNEFGNITKAQYLQKANLLIHSYEVQVKTRPNGDQVFFNADTNEFAVTDKNGIIRTYFIPDPEEHGYKTNQDYFDAH